MDLNQFLIINKRMISRDPNDPLTSEFLQKTAAEAGLDAGQVGEAVKTIGDNPKTLTDLAKNVNVTPAFISKLRHGTTSVGLSTALRIVDQCFGLVPITKLQKRGRGK